MNDILAADLAALHGDGAQVVALLERAVTTQGTFAVYGAAGEREAGLARGCLVPDLPPPDPRRR